jgi:hypothetical protein
MSNPYKRFEKSIARLETYPTVDGWSGKALARNLKNTFEALVDVIEQEQSFRLSHPKYKPTGPWDTISSKSDMVLSAHKGWAYRVIDTADSELESKGTLWDNGPEAGVLNRSRMELLRTYKTFAPAKNLWLARIIHSVLRGVKKLWNARPRLPKTIQEPEKSVFDEFKSLQFKNDPMSALDAYATAEPNMPGALLLKPEEADKHGIEIKPQDRQCSNLVCFAGEVRGARWGSEDYPCPVCNKDAYDAWIREEHPEEVKEKSKVILPEAPQGVSCALCLDTKTMGPEWPDVAGQPCKHCQAA